MIPADIRMEAVPKLERAHPPVTLTLPGEPQLLIVRDVLPHSPLRAGPSNFVIAAVALGVALAVALWIVLRRRSRR